MLSDIDHLELDALIQARIDTPRAHLSPAEIADAVARFDPGQRIWPNSQSGKRKSGTCPQCGTVSASARGCGAGKRYYTCWRCGKRWGVAQG